jgi:hypothetical protein
MFAFGGAMATKFPVIFSSFFINGMSQWIVYMIIASDHSSAYFPLHQHFPVSPKNVLSCYWGRHTSIFLNLHAWKEPWVNEEPTLWCVNVVILVLPWLNSCDTEAHEWGRSAVSFQ